MFQGLEMTFPKIRNTTTLKSSEYLQEGQKVIRKWIHLGKLNQVYHKKSLTSLTKKTGVLQHVAHTSNNL